MKNLEKEVVRLEKVTPMRRESGWEKQGKYATYIKREDIVSISNRTTSTWTSILILKTRIPVRCKDDEYIQQKIRLMFVREILQARSNYDLTEDLEFIFVHHRPPSSPRSFGYVHWKL